MTGGLQSDLVAYSTSTVAMRECQSALMNALTQVTVLSCTLVEMQQQQRLHNRHNRLLCRSCTALISANQQVPATHLPYTAPLLQNSHVQTGAHRT